MPEWSPPTKVRWLTDDEWSIVRGVFWDTLPYRQRIFLTDAAGENGRAFAIPTSVITGAVGTAFGGALAGPAGAALGAMLNWGLSFANVGYVIGVGPHKYPDMTKHPGLLVHEVTHVWQGKNSAFALTYVLDSALAQCLLGSTAAYTVTPGDPWRSYNAEQQASIVEHWYLNGCLTTDDDDHYPYIRDHIREGTG